MEMTKTHVARVAKNLLATLKENNLLAPIGLAKAKGQTFGDQIDDAHGGEEYVEIAGHPADPSAFVIKYVRRTGQTPIQMIIRPAGCKIMLTCTEQLPGYTVFDEEPSFGKMQDKSVKDYPSARAELETLVKL